ncbi:alpha/beta fold hydrolase [Marinomonas epiphytica]
MSDVFFLSLPQVRMAYRLYENPKATTDRCALLLHGAGVAGEITYSPMLPYLETWRWLLVPDLKGMGESFFPDAQEAPVSISELSDEVAELLAHLEWQDFDMIAYSLGGLVALDLNAKRVAQGLGAINMALMEPASLEREDITELMSVRLKYREASRLIRETGDVELGVAQFMDGVSPNRRKHPVAESTTQSRLAHRAFGFAYALDAVTDFVEQMLNEGDQRAYLVAQAPKVLLLSGALSHTGLKDHYEVLSKANTAWQHVSLSACDHSLPFQKPRQIAKHINGWFSA